MNLQFVTSDPDGPWCRYTADVDVDLYGCKLDSLTVGGFSTDPLPHLGKAITYPEVVRVARTSGSAQTGFIDLNTSANTLYDWFFETGSTPIACATASCAAGNYEVWVERAGFDLNDRRHSHEPGGPVHTHNEWSIPGNRFDCSHNTVTAMSVQVSAP